MVRLTGIGKAIATALLEAGARVIVNGRNQDRVDSTVEELRTMSASGKEDFVKGVAADLSTAEGANELCDAVDATGKPLDILVCNTGIFEAKVSVSWRCSALPARMAWIEHLMSR